MLGAGGRGEGREIQGLGGGEVDVEVEQRQVGGGRMRRRNGDGVEAGWRGLFRGSMVDCCGGGGRKAGWCQDWTGREFLRAMWKPWVKGDPYLFSPINATR